VYPPRPRRLRRRRGRPHEGPDLALRRDDPPSPGPTPTSSTRWDTRTRRAFPRSTSVVAARRAPFRRAGVEHDPVRQGARRTRSPTSSHSCFATSCAADVHAITLSDGQIQDTRISDATGTADPSCDATYSVSRHTFAFKWKARTASTTLPPPGPLTNDQFGLSNVSCADCPASRNCDNLARSKLGFGRVAAAARRGNPGVASGAGGAVGSGFHRPGGAPLMVTEPASGSRSSRNGVRRRGCDFHACSAASMRSSVRSASSAAGASACS
jgi:hypothetical protein